MGDRATGSGPAKPSGLYLTQAYLLPVSQAARLQQLSARAKALRLGRFTGRPGLDRTLPRPGGRPERPGLHGTQHALRLQA